MSSKEITATLEIVTPMFLGDASPQDLADTIRPPSIKGALRFWWRALNWSRVYRGDSEADKRAALNDLHRREAELFGLAADEADSRQSRVLIRSTTKLDNTRNDWPKKDKGSGYLGLGLFESGNKDKNNYAPPRIAFSQGQRFDVALRFHPKSSNDDITSIRKAFSAWGTFGGLGSRGQRRGFGSVALLEMDGQPATPKHASDYLSTANDYIDSANGVTSQPPYTAFSHGTRIALLSQQSDPLAAHAAMGNAFKEHRGQASELRGRAKIPFGLPLAKVDDASRRASPLLFHVHPVSDGYIGVVLFIPAFFHHQHPTVSYTEVERFLDRAQEARA